MEKLNHESLFGPKNDMGCALFEFIQKNVIHYNFLIFFSFGNLVNATFEQGMKRQHILCDIVDSLTIHAKDTFMNRAICFFVNAIQTFFFLRKMATSNTIAAYRVFCRKNPMKCWYVTMKGNKSTILCVLPLDSIGL